jgi:hypothetical protein
LQHLGPLHPWQFHVQNNETKTKGSSLVIRQ